MAPNKKRKTGATQSPPPKKKVAAKRSEEEEAAAAASEKPLPKNPKGKATSDAKPAASKRTPEPSKATKKAEETKKAAETKKDQSEEPPPAKKPKNTPTRASKAKDDEKTKDDAPPKDPEDKPKTKKAAAAAKSKAKKEAAEKAAALAAAAAAAAEEEKALEEAVVEEAVKATVLEDSEEFKDVAATLPAPDEDAEFKDAVTGEEPAVSEEAKAEVVAPKKSSSGPEPFHQQHCYLCGQEVEVLATHFLPSTKPFPSSGNKKSKASKSCRKSRDQVRAHCLKKKNQHYMLWEVAQKSDFLADNDVLKSMLDYGPTWVLLHFMLSSQLTTDGCDLTDQRPVDGARALLQGLCEFKGVFIPKAMNYFTGCLTTKSAKDSGYEILEDKNAETDRRRQIAEGAGVLVSSIVDKAFEWYNGDRNELTRDDLCEWLPRSLMKVPGNKPETLDRIVKVIADRMFAIYRHNELMQDVPMIMVTETPEVIVAEQTEDV